MIGYPCCRRLFLLLLFPGSNLCIRESLTRFHSRSAPSITVLDYLKRIVKFTNVEVCIPRLFFDHGSSYHPSSQKSCLLITLHYVDQICARMPLFTLSSLTCHRFIIASITVSSKALCDTFCTNNLYAKVGGISVTELNILEREFLSAIDWRLMVSKFSSPSFPNSAQPVLTTNGFWYWHSHCPHGSYPC